MMTTDPTPTGLSGLLPQILGCLGEGGVPEGADGGGFVQSLADHIKSLMLERGDDPTVVAAIDDESLVAQFFALVQAQSESAAGGLSVMGDPGGMIGLAEASSDSDEEASEIEATTPADLAALPIVVLERLSEAGRILPSESLERPLESTSDSVDLETLTRTLLRQTTVSTPAGGDVPAESESLDMTESAPALPSWLARQSARGDTALDSASSRLELGELMEFEERRESGQLTDLVPTGSTRTPATETSTPGVRLQTLDLNRLLQPGGEQRLAEQVRWSVDQGLDTAEIKLHPPSLGALDVRLVQEGDKTHVQFVSAHPIAREVLEAAVPRLREALAQEGVLLGNVSVSDQAPNDRGETGREHDQSAGTDRSRE
ncbi:MAG: flagellar hook-length control protein FliK [Chromatiales bacterium]|nr:flagellar hook-length control protein FliK [Chromatiales bacterium]